MNQDQPKTLASNVSNPLVYPLFEEGNGADFDEPNFNRPIERDWIQPASYNFMSPSNASGGPSGGGVDSAKTFKLAEQPELGARYFNETPIGDAASFPSEPFLDDFAPTPIAPDFYDSEHEKWVYQGKTLNANQRPLLELFRPWYQLGQLPEPKTFLGFHNPVLPQFLIFGDFRTAVANNRANSDSNSLIAWQLNLNLNLSITSTERFIFGMTPLSRNNSTRWLTDQDRLIEEFNPNITFGHFEGDLGAIVGGMTGQTLPFDLPFSVGYMPMLVQNGVWMEDAFIGVAATIPARNSPQLNISNMDVTFLMAFDEISTGAFDNNTDAGKMYGVLTFIEALGGYFEIDYAYIEDRSSLNRSYHNAAFAYTRRYGRWISNSVRVISNVGQQTASGVDTAEGTLLLLENSLITSQPATFVPYLNMWAGFDRPHAAARAPASGGVLRNTGILFESDGMTAYPTLDATGHNTFGAAIGLNILATDFSQQLIVEAAALQVLKDSADRNVQGNQYGVGFRYQLPLSNSWILRTDGMYGFFDGADDALGARMELRKKF